MEQKDPKFKKPPEVKDLEPADKDKVSGGRGIYTCGSHCATQVPTSTYLRIYMIYD